MIIIPSCIPIHFYTCWILSRCYSQPSASRDLNLSRWSDVSALVVVSAALSSIPRGPWRLAMQDCATRGNGDARLTKIKADVKDYSSRTSFKSLQVFKLLGGEGKKPAAAWNICVEAAQIVTEISAWPGCNIQMRWPYPQSFVFARWLDSAVWVGARLLNVCSISFVVRRLKKLHTSHI